MMKLMRERLLSLQGGRNFRDLGGYVTSDGRSVRWHKVYRSGTLVLLDARRYRASGVTGDTHSFRFARP